MVGDQDDVFSLIILAVNHVIRPPLPGDFAEFSSSSTSFRRMKCHLRTDPFQNLISVINDEWTNVEGLRNGPRPLPLSTEVDRDWETCTTVSQSRSDAMARQRLLQKHGFVHKEQYGATK